MPVSTASQPIENYTNQGDVLGERVITEIFDSTTVDEANTILRDLLYCKDPYEIHNLHPQLLQFLRSTSSLPDWADQQRIRNGQTVFSQHAPLCLLSLLLASLPECYANSSVAQVLGETQQLQNRAYKRIIETAQFLVHVMAPDGLTTSPQPDLGLRVIQRIRLIHAAVRYFIKQDQRSTPQPYLRIDWSAGEAEPISQIDLAYTLQTFCWVTLRTLRIDGANLTPQQEADYIHVWNVIGHQLGVDACLLPLDASEAETLFETIKSRYASNSEQGIAMTVAAMQVLSRMLGERLGFVGRLVSRLLPRLLIFQFLDASTRDLLAVKDPNFIEKYIALPIAKFLRWFAKFITRYFKIPLAGKFDTWMGFKLLQYYSRPPDYLGLATFDIPDSLRAERSRWWN